MKHKKKVLELFVEWKRNMEQSMRKETKLLYSDNGGEYRRDPFLHLCQYEGIERHFKVRKIPQQNRVAEKINRIFLEKVSCMFSNANISKYFWS